MTLQLSGVRPLRTCSRVVEAIMRVRSVACRRMLSGMSRSVPPKTMSTARPAPDTMVATTLLPAMPKESSSRKRMTAAIMAMRSTVVL